MERRTFLKLLLGGMLVPPMMHGQDGVLKEGRRHNANKVVVLSDLHVGVSSGQWQRDGLTGRIASILSMEQLPRCVLILGDIAYSQGDVADYELFKTMMAPLDKAGVPWYPMMGNHDNREAFFTVFPEKKAASLVRGRLVTVVKTPCADFVLLDSLKNGKIGGEIDDEQRRWLKSFLAKQRKPTFVCAHHPLIGMKLQYLLEGTTCVAGYFHGHLHSWRSTQMKKGLATISFPSTGQWGDIGYAVLTLNHSRACVRSTIVDYYYPMPKEPPKPEWLARIQQKDGEEVVIPLGIV